MEYAKYEMHKMILYWAFSYSQFSFIMLFQTYCKLKSIKLEETNSEDFANQRLNVSENDWY